MIYLAYLSIAGQQSTIVIDASQKTPISPYIYGLNYPDSSITDWLKDWQDNYKGVTMVRQGGNRLTAYNWETNASNAGNDYFNENDGYLGESNEPGWTVKKFMTALQSTGAVALLTVPTQGHVSADKDPNMNGDKDVIKTPDYLNVRFYPSYASKPGHVPTAAPDLSDKAVFQSDFVTWVMQNKSTKSPVWFALDNEPDLWHSTHSRIELQPTTYARIISNNLEYATMIKSIDPAALVFGPVNYGWQGFHTFQDAPDAAGRNFVDTYLDAMREANQKLGKRVLDVYDFHYYPEATGDGIRVTGGSADKPGTALARIQAPRSLWDPNFVEDSWITKSNGGKPLALLPDMNDRIQKHYPGTKLSVTEYDFGGRNSISGALAEADALGVFGRYGVFAASHWGLNRSEKPAFAALQAFINFDRHGSSFGDLGLSVSGEAPAQDSVYASLDSKHAGRMTIVAINKTSSAMPLHFVVKGFRGSAVRSFVVAEGSYDQPANGKAEMSGNAVEMQLPAMSITTIEVLK